LRLWAGLGVGRACSYYYNTAAPGRLDPGPNPGRTGAREVLKPVLVFSTLGVVHTQTKAEDRTTAARQFAVEAARLAADTHCHSVVVLDVRGISPVTDFFILATGTSPRQMRSVADEIAELGQKHSYAPLSTNGYEGHAWILVDFVDVVLHIFSGDARTYYDLDNLWGDAQRVEWEK
jgi:ribosome-associated protein